MPDAAHSYTPTGRSAVFFVPAYDDNADLRILFSQFADTASSVDGDTYTGVHNFTGGLQKSGADVVTTTGTQTLTNKTISQSQVTSLTSDLSSKQTQIDNLETNVAAKYPLNPLTNPSSSSYTLQLSDAQKIIEMNVATENTLTIPPNTGANSAAFPIGTSILVVQTGEGQTTITAGVGVTVNSFIGLKIIGQWAGCTLIKRDTNTWVAVGGLVA